MPKVEYPRYGGVGRCKSDISVRSRDLGNQEIWMDFKADDRSVMLIRELLTQAESMNWSTKDEGNWVVGSLRRQSRQRYVGRWVGR